MTPEETDGALDTFWRVAVFHARLNGVPSYFGPTPLEVVRPPAWSYGETPEEADAFLASVRSGATTATAMPLAELEQVGEPVPQPGELGIVLDGRGDPQALVSVSEVLLVPYAEVDPGSTLVEGEGLVADTPMVVQRLKVLHAD
ncbi:ASCH domain-containing protein [Nocardioides euryhalodurans]|uniref:ASCH domain-containing protein n=1 Tax=Nocardioides euryhalodurans TaxID=2518370 RepID=A0A4P7GHD1_9ACTN|nr:ASCH domain-containing protein [Nocardioides euryhalodurans]QBR91069.1 ASCH domain-containing protein [Nocardioides euryhalodurans]